MNLSAIVAALWARVQKEPIVALTIAGVVALSAYKVLVEHMPMSQVLGQNYLSWAFLAVANFIARFQVWAKGNLPAQVTQGKHPHGEDDPEYPR